jgi:hypothetical protein
MTSSILGVFEPLASSDVLPQHLFKKVQAWNSKPHSSSPSHAGRRQRKRVVNEIRAVASLLKAQADEEDAEFVEGAENGYCSGGLATPEAPTVEVVTQTYLPCLASRTCHSGISVCACPA